jgi:hypothetical protein
MEKQCPTAKGAEFCPANEKQSRFSENIFWKSSEIHAASFALASRISYTVHDFAERLASAGFLDREMICLT